MSNNNIIIQSSKGSILHHALHHIDDSMARQKQEVALASLRQIVAKTRNIYSNDVISKSTMEMLHRHGIILATLPEDFKEYRIGSFAQSFTGVGIRNSENGICFYQDKLGRPVIIGTSSYTFVSVEKGRNTDECIVFYDIMDYLSYLTVMTHSKGSIIKPAYDVVILNDFKNITISQDLVLSYKAINTFFPRGESYNTIINTYQHLSDNRVSDCSWFYQKKDYDTFFEFCEATFGEKSSSRV